MISEKGAYDAFEKSVNTRLGNEIRLSDSAATEMWSALANVGWIHSEYGEIGYSFRAAGDLIAGIRQQGSYLDWYCSGPYAVVARGIAEALAEDGWIYKLYE